MLQFITMYEGLTFKLNMGTTKLPTLILVKACEEPATLFG